MFSFIAAGHSFMDEGCNALTSGNKGYNLLRKLGWKENTGLGAHGEGRKVPIIPEMKQGRGGLGVSPPPPTSAAEIPRTIPVKKHRTKRRRTTTAQVEEKDGTKGGTSRNKIEILFHDDLNKIETDPEMNNILARRRRTGHSSNNPISNIWEEIEDRDAS